MAQQRPKIIRNGVALVGKESVSGLPAAAAAGQSGEPTHVSILSAMTESRCAATHRPQPVNGEIAVASQEESHAAPFSGKRLLALWNAVPGIKKGRKVGGRDELIDQLWSAI